MSLRGRLAALPPIVLITLGMVALGAVVAGGVFAYRTYDYIEHDNDFCMSCHLMQEPYERFARSEHRELGCKACHQPTFGQRSSMALTQIAENPDSLAEHAEVPNERCEECHVRGDRQKWLLVSQSAGHRIHLESSDSTLQGLRCVECHSTSVHEFASSDRTCGQSECHQSTEVKLGAMGALTIHCAACHDFNAPAATVPTDSLSEQLRPQRDECLSCHAMRVLVAGSPLPVDDPHGGSCGACHNPHEQATPADAVATCANAGCHESSEEVTPFHRGIAEPVFADCLRCHQAHAFAATGAACSDCHAEATRPGGIAVVRVSGSAARARPFRHETHTGVTCASCHESTDTHGRTTVTAAAQCQACHHAPAEAEPCAECHAPRSVPAARLSRVVDLDIGVRATRSLPFDHDRHNTVACSQCHAATPNQSAASVSCADCHTDHHKPASDCMACHAQPKENAHTLNAHLTCSGAGCHGPPTAFNPVPRTRSFCLVCHQDLVDHRPGEDCAACHALPRGQP